MYSFYCHLTSITIYFIFLVSFASLSKKNSHTLLAVPTVLCSSWHVHWTHIIEKQLSRSIAQHFPLGILLTWGVHYAVTGEWDLVAWKLLYTQRLCQFRHLCPIHWCQGFCALGSWDRIRDVSLIPFIRWMCQGGSMPGKVILPPVLNKDSCHVAWFVSCRQACTYTTA